MIAHLVTTGLGPLYDGIGHFAVSPEDALVTLALALLAGLRGATAARWTVLTLPPAWYLGGIAGLLAAKAPAASWGGVSLLLIGALVAAEAPLGPRALALLAAATGLLHGWMNGAALKTSEGTSIALLGIAAACAVLLILASAIAISLQQKWQRLALRVAGSWIAAIGLLLLGWSLRS